MSEYTVTGRFRVRDGWQDFETTIEGENEDIAVEHTYAEVGSRHNVPRPQVEIEEVEGR